MTTRRSKILNLAKGFYGRSKSSYRLAANRGTLTQTLVWFCIGFPSFFFAFCSTTSGRMMINTWTFLFSINQNQSKQTSGTITLILLSFKQKICWHIQWICYVRVATVCVCAYCAKMNSKTIANSSSMIASHRIPWIEWLIHAKKNCTQKTSKTKTMNDKWWTKRMTITITMTTITTMMTPNNNNHHNHKTNESSS